MLCSVGTFYKSSIEDCVRCPPGTYQDQEGQTDCKPCPHNKVGVGPVGATNSSQCTSKSTAPLVVLNGTTFYLLVVYKSTRR